MSHEATKYKVVGIGELLWDLLPEGRQLGGAPANFAYHAKAICGSGIPVSCVAADKLGDEAIAVLAQNGLPSDYIAIDDEHATGTVTVSLDAAGIPNYSIHQNVAWDFIPQTPALIELANQADAICFGALAQRATVSRKTIQAFLDAARTDCLKVFDINLRQAYYDEAIIRASLERANVLKLNDEELPVLQAMLDLPKKESDALRQLLKDFGLQLIALTRGAKGALMVTPKEEAFQAGLPPQRIADTVGAGDAFTAAMTVGLLQEHGLARICSEANQLASYVCSQHGAMPAIPEMKTDPNRKLQSETLSSARRK